jgi:hypothetical protein
MGHSQISMAFSSTHSLASRVKRICRDSGLFLVVIA